MDSKFNEEAIVGGIIVFLALSILIPAFAYLHGYDVGKLRGELEYFHNNKTK